MGTFTGYLKYKNPDWTASINKRTKEAWKKGIWSGAEVTPVGSNMAVYVAPFVSHGNDGLVVFYEGSSATVTVPSTGRYYILIHSYYIGGAEPLMELVAMYSRTWDGLTSSEKDEYINVATVTVPSGHTTINVADISYKERDSLDVVGRSEFRGNVSNIASLPVNINNKPNDMWVVYEASSGIAPKLVIWKDTAPQAWVDIQDETLNAVLESHRGNGVGLKDNATPVNDEKHLTDDEYDAITNSRYLPTDTLPSTHPLDVDNYIVGSEKPLAKNDKQSFSLIATPSDYVTITVGNAYIGTGAVGSANKFFKLVISDTLANLTGTDGGIILVGSIYDSTNTSELIPAVDNDPLMPGFYANPTIRFDMSGTSMTLYNNTLDIIFGSPASLGELTGEDILLAGQVNDYRPSASSVYLDSSSFNIFNNSNNQLEFNMEVDDFLYPPIEYDLSASTDNRLLVIENTTGNPTYSLTHFSKEQVINGITTTGTDAIEYLLSQYSYGIPAKGGLFYISELNGSSHNKYYLVSWLATVPSGADQIVTLHLKDMNDNDPNFTIGYTATGYIVNGIFIKNDGSYSGITLQKRQTSSSNTFSIVVNKPYSYSGATIDRTVFKISDPVLGDRFSITENGKVSIRDSLLTYGSLIHNGNNVIFQTNGDDFDIITSGGVIDINSGGGDISIFSDSGEIYINTDGADMYVNAGSGDINVTNAGMYVDNSIEAGGYTLNSLSPKTIFQGTEGMTGTAITNNGYTNEGFIPFNGGVAGIDSIVIRVPINPGDKYIYSDIKINAIALTPLKKVIVTLYSKNINDAHWTNVTSQDYGSTPGDIPFTPGNFSLSPNATAFIAASNTIYAIGIITDDIAGSPYQILTALGSYWELELSDPEIGFI